VIVYWAPGTADDIPYSDVQQTFYLMTVSG
jgi:hypothetical protein